MIAQQLPGQQPQHTNEEMPNLSCVENHGKYHVL